MDNQQQVQSRWGYVFEIAVKRGVLNYLLYQKLFNLQHPALQEWQIHNIGTLMRSLIKALQIVSETDVYITENYCKHLLIMGYGLGWTTIRTWLTHLKYTLTPRQQNSPIHLKYLWAPLAFSGTEFYTDLEQIQTVQPFWDTLGLPGQPAQEWGYKGKPANADFLMQLVFPNGVEHLLCLEFSLDTSMVRSDGLRDFRLEESHLDELSRYVRLMESRSIFSRVNAEVSGDHFALGSGILSHVNAFFDQKNKSFSKLWQGASYLTEFINLLDSRNILPNHLHGHVLSITSDGLEGMNAPFNPNIDNPKANLLRQLGKLYQHKRSNVDPDVDIRSVFRHIKRALPATFQAQVQKHLQDLPTPKQIIDLRIQETVDKFINPVTEYPYTIVCNWLKNETQGKDNGIDKVADYFGQTPQQAILEILQQDRSAEADPRHQKNAKADPRHQKTEPQSQIGPLNLRTIHNAAVRAAIKAAKPKTLNVLALEGNPGIGKTYAILQAIRNMPEGFLFIYISPRVAINDKVVTNLSKAPDILAITCNTIINQGAKAWYAEHHDKYAYPDLQYIINAVTHNSLHGFIPPKTNTLYLTAEQAQEIDDHYGETGLSKQRLDISNYRLQQQLRPGIMQTLGKTCRDSLETNQHINKIVLTSSIQAYKEIAKDTKDTRKFSNTNSKISTIDILFKALFKHSQDTPKGIAERRRFLQRMPNIIVMIDEIAGDSAGTPLVHAFAKQLRQQFIYPFADDGNSPPVQKLVLALSDASLGNPQVLQAYLKDTHNAPEKVMVSPSQGQEYFRMQVAPLQLAARETSTLHILANSFPASNLQIDYAIRLIPIHLQQEADGTLQHPRVAIRNQAEKHQLITAIAEIFRAFEHISEDQQVILFAQNKTLLRELQETVFNDDKLQKLQIDLKRPACLKNLQKDSAILDHSVHPKERRRLLKPDVRDSKKLWLMTSSGSRGIDFPQATYIIAFVPGFSIESGLMEIAQLIYRGRGSGGDQYKRRLVMLLYDFVIYQVDKALDERRWQRQTLDLLSMLMLLRASILTRIQGDAGIPRQHLAIVPVGRIGVENIIYTMSQTIAQFLKEAQLFIADSRAPQDLKNLVRPARDQVLNLFTNLDVEKQFKPLEYQGSISNLAEIAAHFKAVTNFSSKFLTNDIPWIIADYLHCTGPLWLEDWGRNDIAEHLTLRLWDNVLLAYATTLNKLLYGLNQKNIPSKLKRTARDLKKILDSDILYTDNILPIEQRIAQSISNGQTWSVWPLDYPRFLQDATAWPLLQDPDAWHSNLKAAASVYRPPAAIHPPIPKYRSAPFVNLVLSDTPINFERVLDERYFSAGLEFNLLNIILWGK